MSKENAFEEVMAARFITEKLGAIHGLQADTLVAWAYLAMPHIKAGEVELGIYTEQQLVQYTVKTKKKPPKRLRKMLANLRVNIQTLLGPEWDMRVIHNSKTIFSVQRNIAEKMNARRAAAAALTPRPDVTADQAD